MLRFSLLTVLGSLALVMVAVRIFIWQWRPHTRPCNWFGHDKRYVALALKGCVVRGSPESSGRGFPCDHDHQIGEKGIYIARWACRRCPKMGEECLGKDQDWTIQHEKLVPDVKKWANWSEPLPPPIDACLAAREKLKAIQERIADPKPVTVKTEIVKNKNYCNTCGWNHDGPCVPRVVEGSGGGNR